MEYAEGGNLYDLIKMHKKKRKKFSEFKILTWFYQLCKAIEYCHEKK
jgi:serine/threonine protein kinase